MWTLPSGTTRATRDEVIIAALERGKLQDPNWRGQRGELDDLFFQPFQNPPAPGSREERIVQISQRLNATQMNALGFADDYFPHGGIIGAAELQLPSVIAQAPPFELIGKVFDASNPTWLADAQNLFNNYLTASTTIGQMAAYIPAPNVPQGFDFNSPNNGPQQLIDSLITGDPLSIIKKTAPQGIYPFDQVLLAGWAKAQLLGMPLAEGKILFDPAGNRFALNAGVPAGSWLRDIVGVNLEVTIKQPTILNTAPTGNTIEEIYAAVPKGTVQERFEALAATLTNAPAAISSTITQIQDTLPKISAEAAATIQIPASLQPFLRTQANAGLAFFAYSPGFDPAFGRNGPGTADDDFSPLAVAKRRGGVGVKGKFDLSYTPPTGEPLIIKIDDASFAITPGADNIFPALSGQLLATQVSIPGAPTVRKGVVQFASSPDNGAPYMKVGLEMDPFSVAVPGQPNLKLLDFQSLNGTFLGGELSITRADGQPANTAVSLRMKPMSITIPMLGDQAAVALHGGEVSPGEFNDFSFSTATGQAWSAQMTISEPGDFNAPPSLQIRDPLNPQNPQVLMSITASGVVHGSLSGVGLSTFQGEFTVTGNTAPAAPTAVTFYPGTEQESTLNLPSAAGFVVAFDSAGRFYCNLGALTNISLPGLMSANAKIEFGYNPDDPQPNIGRSPTTLAFGSLNLVSSASQSVTISNTGTQASNVSLSISQTGTLKDFEVAGDGFQLEPGGSRTVRVLFQPKAGGGRSATLRIVSDDPDSPLLTVPLSGTGLVEPIYFQSRPSPITFGRTLVGGTSSTTITIGNSGSANMVINSATLTAGSPFTISPAGSVTLKPGDSQLYTATFTPAVLGAATSTLTLAVAAPIGSKTLTLTGTGSESSWVAVLDSVTAGNSNTLNAIKMIDDKRGWVAGNAGTLLETRNGGRSWSPRRLTNQNLNALALSETAINEPVVAVYHLEEPTGSPSYLDASGSNLHGTAPIGPEAPTQSFSNGQFGSGLGFDGVNDYAELGTFALPQDFTISLWVRFDQTTDSQMVLGKYTTTGALRFLFGKYSGGYRVQIGSQAWTVPATPVVGAWMHFVLTGDFDSVANTTTVTMYRDGSNIGSNVFTGAPSTAGGKPWVLGTDWDSDTLRSEFFKGAIDEVWFFNGLLSSSERTGLRTQNGRRLVVAGAGGLVYQTFTDGDTWGQLPDLNAYGWRNLTRTFERRDWFSASFAGLDLYLGGRQLTSGISFRKTVMVEDFGLGVDGLQNTDDDEFAEVTLPGGSGLTPGFIVLGMATNQGQNKLFVSNEGIAYQQNSSTPGSATALTPTAAGSLNAAAAHGLFTEYTAVGNSGAILSANNGAFGTRVSSTTANLRGIAFTNANPQYHVVGDNGVYLTSDNNGVNWTVANDGLTGNMRSVDAKAVPGGAATNYHVWAVGEQSKINYRPPVEPSGPFFTCYPGQLDYGFVTTNESRTLFVKVTNRGKQPLTVSASGASISGPAANRFSLATTSIGRLEPDDTTEIPVRYRPTATSEFDYAELTLATNDGDQSFRVPLFGQSAANEWRPVVISANGVPVVGEVVKVEFITANLGYALVNPPTGASKLYRTENGGSSWIQVGSNFPNLGGTLRFTSLAYTSDFSDLIYLGGRVENASGALIKGAVIVGQVESTEIAPGEFAIQEQWSDSTPLSSGQSIQPLAIADVGAFTAQGANSSGSALVASTTGSSTTSTIYKKTSGAWTTTTNRPSSTFNGGPVAVSAYDADFAAFQYFGATASELFANALTATNWASTAKRLQTGPAQIIRDIDFDLNLSDPNGIYSRGWLVGDDGLFFRLRGGSISVPDEILPASDAEVFGTTDLKAVDFAGQRNGWVVGQSKIFNTTDEGATWAVNFDAGSTANILCVKVLTGAKVWSGGSLDGKATIWRYTPPPAATKPLLTSVSFKDFGTVTAGSVSGTQNIAITNNGASALALQEIGIESDEPRSRFRIVGQPPATVAAGGTVNVPVVFDAALEPSIADTMSPEFIHRFEGDWADTVYRDDSSNHRDATAPTTVTQRPTPASSVLRDRCLRFDGTDDRLEITGALETLPANWTVSLWAAPEAVPTSDRVMLSKDLSTGGDGLKILLTSTGYRVVIRGTSFTGGGVPTTDFQHILVKGVQSGSSTIVTFYRDGEILWTQTLAAVAGNLTGRPWTLGAEWTSASATAGHFLGCLDDAALFPRTLTDKEIARLAAKSPVYGEHRAQLVVNSGSEKGVRVIDLRALVPEASDMMVFNTEPQGRSLVIDGVARTTPVAFAISPFASGSASSLEWVEGSRHTITTQEASFTLTNADISSASYVFSEWSGAPTRAWTLTAARTGSMSQIATFVPGTLTPPAPIAPPPPRVMGPNVLLSGLTNSPKGPFFRLSNGSLKIPNLGASGFAITGELLVSLVKIKGHLETTALKLPDTGTPHLELGESRWLIDATAGGNFLLQASPPSLRLLGNDVLPDGQATLRYTKAAGVNPAKWSAEFQLRRDYKPAPDMLEFKKGFTKVEWLASGLPGFAVEFQGGLRLLKQPSGVFAFDKTMNVRLDTINFNVSVNSMLASAGLPQPTQLFSAGPLKVGWGDLRVKRSNGGPVFLELVSLPFDVNGTNVATVSGSLSTNGALGLNGTLTALSGGGKAIRLDPAGQLTLEKTGSGSATFDLLLQAFPTPRFALSTPTLILKSTAGEFPSGGLTIPGIDLDTSGAFDTGKLPLPSFSFDGIGVSGDPDGKLKHNHIRLARDTSGKATFTIKSEQQFLSCRQRMKLSIVTGGSPKISGSMEGNFCVLPEPISLSFDSSKTCQFEGTAFGFTVRFGTNCAEVTW